MIRRQLRISSIPGIGAWYICLVHGYLHTYLVDLVAMDHDGRFLGLRRRLDGNTSTMLQ